MAICKVCCSRRLYGWVGLHGCVYVTSIALADGSTILLIYQPSSKMIIADVLIEIKLYYD